jgi:hypothetical protein
VRSALAVEEGSIRGVTLADAIRSSDFAGPHFGTSKGCEPGTARGKANVGHMVIVSPKVVGRILSMLLMKVNNP